MVIMAPIYNLFKKWRDCLRVRDGLTPMVIPGSLKILTISFRNSLLVQPGRVFSLRLKMMTAFGLSYTGRLTAS